MLSWQFSFLWKFFSGISIDDRACVNPILIHPSLPRQLAWDSLLISLVKIFLVNLAKLANHHRSSWHHDISITDRYI